MDRLSSASREDRSADADHRNGSGRLVSRYTTLLKPTRWSDHLLWTKLASYPTRDKIAEPWELVTVAGILGRASTRGR